ncbi:hypothetical protein A9Q87_13880, partial [Flavobacteriales bacterium 34_180_T64]
MILIGFTLFYTLSFQAQTVTFHGNNNLIIDSNKSCPGPNQEGPLAVYIPYEFCNTTGVTGPLTATLTVSGAGYGLASNQPATQNIGVLANGECKTIYWFIVYPCVPEAQVGTITADLKDESGTTIASSTDSLVNEKGNSANATGLLISEYLTSDNGIGQIAMFDVAYEFGNPGDGDNIDFQPAGNTDFNAECFQLVGVEILASDLSCVPVGSVDQMFFSIDAICAVNGSGIGVTARYYFKLRCVDASTQAQPYAYGQSGIPLKYTGNYEAFQFTTFPTTVNNLNITKTVSPISTITTPTTITYTVGIENTSASPASIDNITDILPGAFSFNALHVASDITVNNAVVLPAFGDTGVLDFVGGSPSTIYPFTEFVVSGNTTLNVIYTVDVPTGTTPGVYINNVTFTTGTFTSAPATADFLVISDEDGDGVPTSEDCDDNDPLNTNSNINDADCDGVPTSEDCDDNDPLNTNSNVNDADCDGIPTSEDCDDNDPLNTNS